MTDKLGIVAYLPPDFGYTDSFHANLLQFKTRYPLYLYSDAPERWGLNLRIPVPGHAVNYRNVPLSLNNYVFLKGIEVAMANGLDFYIYLEEDCRVRSDYWDERMFVEFFQTGGEPLIGGTASVWNMGLSGHEAALRSIEFSRQVVKKTGRPPLFWQSVGRDGPVGLWLYPNGAGSIFHTATVNAMFGAREYDIGTFCATLGAWDMHAGKAMWNQFGLETFERFSIIPSQYSGYKDCHYSNVERRKMLCSGEIVLMHQEKSPWIPDK